jgi:hypothetical protein
MNGVPTGDTSLTRHLFGAARSIAQRTIDTHGFTLFGLVCALRNPKSQRYCGPESTACEERTAGQSGQFRPTVRVPANQSHTRRSEE